MLVLFITQLNIYGQSGRTYKSTIVFSSDVLTSVMVNDPIDNASNLYYTTNTFKLTPQQPITHIVKINGFSTINVEYSNGLKASLLVLENEHIEICITNNKIIIKGDNAAGNQYLIDNYYTKGLGYYFSKVFNVLKKFKSPAIDMKKIDKEIKDSVLSTYRNDIHKLQREKQITNRFANLMDKSIENGYTSLEFITYTNFFFGRRAEQRLTTLDSLTVVERINQKYKESLSVTNPQGYYYHYPFIGYYEFKYKKMNDNLKKQLTGNYDDDTFGSFAFLLLAPDSLQQVLLGPVIVSAIQNRDNFFDNSKIQAYFNRKFPNSEYVPLINDLLKKQSEKLIEKVDSSKYIFIDKSVNTITELVETNSLKGKRIFIDLWSVTCIPCKVQFKYVEQLHKLLEKYENVVPLYITIDDANQEVRWRTDITYFNLQGYHLMANKALYNDLSKVFYGGQSCYIPRYILLDEYGKVLNANLPRPEKIDNLEIVLDSLLKK